MANPVTIKLSKSGGERWGFRLGGGKDFGTPLSIHKVTGGSLAEQAGLRAGDLLTRINDTDTNKLTHKEALDLIAKAKDNFTVTTQRRADVHLAMSTEHMGSPQVMNGPTFKSTSRPVSMVYDNLASPPSTVEEFTEDVIAETLSSQSEVLNTGTLGVNFLKYEKKHYDPQQSAVYKMVHCIDEDPEPKVATLPEKGVEEREVRQVAREPVRPTIASVPAAKKRIQTQPISQMNLEPRPEAFTKPRTIEHKPICVETKSSSAPQAVTTAEPEIRASATAPKQKRVHTNVKPSSVIWPPPPPMDSDEEEETPMLATAVSSIKATAPPTATPEKANFHEVGSPTRTYIQPSTNLQPLKEAATAASAVKAATPPTATPEKPNFHEVGSPAKTYTKPATNLQPLKVATPAVGPQSLPALQPDITSPIAISTANTFSQSVGSPTQQATLLSGPPLPELYPVTGPTMPAVRPYISAAQPVEVSKPTKQYKLPMTPSATLSKPVGPSQPPQKTVVMSSNITPMSTLTRLVTPSIPKSVAAGHDRPANMPSAPEKKRVEGTNKVLNIKSFNSPVGLYSEATLRDAVVGNKEEEIDLSRPFNFGRWEKDYGFLRNSEVYRLIHDMESNPASKEDAGAQ